MKLQNPLKHELACYVLLRLVGYQSSLRPTEDFDNMRPHLLGKVTPFSFPHSYGLEIDWIDDMAKVI
ncbi:hypothetical protein TNCT_371431 [Trichonephila clavata]|uniref:Uncharacterized protein n=1 Tax=Trichonephila clavata TaxID=2740835 RepID=A0A8X6H3G2_TRICU|nr:hypothetical protein TNCT_371431 [Trichonephila clavata]